MTKAAIRRRKCIRAKRTLMRRWPTQYQADYFEDTTKEEFPEFAVGTPLYWTRDIYFGEADCYPADEELRNMLLIESFDWEAEAKKL